MSKSFTDICTIHGKTEFRLWKNGMRFGKQEYIRRCITCKRIQNGKSNAKRRPVTPRVIIASEGTYKRPLYLHSPVPLAYTVPRLRQLQGRTGPAAATGYVPELQEGSSLVLLHMHDL